MGIQLDTKLLLDAWFRQQILGEGGGRMIGADLPKRENAKQPRSERGERSMSTQNQQGIERKKQVIVQRVKMKEEGGREREGYRGWSAEVGVKVVVKMEVEGDAKLWAPERRDFQKQQMTRARVLSVALE
jgi:hypothetical protein